MFGAWPIYFGFIGVNLSIILLGLLVFALALGKERRLKRTALVEIAALLLLVGFAFVTLHGRRLQHLFPIALPERPLVDNTLTFNYALTNLLVYMLLPVLFFFGIGREVSTANFGLHVTNAKYTVLYASFGVIVRAVVFLVSYTLFGYRWISGYTFDGLVLWIGLVSILSIVAQTFFFIAILFTNYLDRENGVVLAAISILATQLFIMAPLPWVIATCIGSATKIAVTRKTRSIYGAIIIGIIVNLLDIVLQIA